MDRDTTRGDAFACGLAPGEKGRDASAMGEAVRERGVPARLLTGRMDGEGTRGDLARDRCGDRRYASSGNGEATGTLSFTSGGPNTRIGSSVPVLVVRSLGILPRRGVPWGGISGSRGGASPSTHWVARPTAGLCWVSIWYRYTRALPWASSRANSVLRPASSRKRSSSTKRRVERRVLVDESVPVRLSEDCWPGDSIM